MEKRIKEAKGEIETIETPFTGQLKLKVDLLGESDTARINVGKNGAATDTSVRVCIQPDGSVNADTVVSCEF